MKLVDDQNYESCKRKTLRDMLHCEKAITVFLEIMTLP